VASSTNPKRRPSTPKATSGSPTGANNRLQEFNEKSEYVRTVGAKGAGQGQLNSPKELKFDTHGNVWVVDEGNYRVEQFNSKYEFQETAGWGVTDGKAELETCTKEAPRPGGGNYPEPNEGGAGEPAEIYDPEGLASYKRTLKRAQELYNDAARGVGAGLLADLILAGVAGTGAEYAYGLTLSAMSLEACVEVGRITGGRAGRCGTCYINEDKILGVPSARLQNSVNTRKHDSGAKTPHNIYYCTGRGQDVWGLWY